MLKGGVIYILWGILNENAMELQISIINELS